MTSDDAPSPCVGATVPDGPAMPDGPVTTVVGYPGTMAVPDGPTTPAGLTG